VAAATAAKTAAPVAVETPEPPHAAHNFRALVGDVSCFFIGMAFLESTTALPAFVTAMGGSPVFLGAILALRQAAYYLPQLFIAHHLRGRLTYKPLLVRVCFWGRLWYFPAALIVLLFGKSHPAIALYAVAFAYFMGWLGDGGGSVPWTAIIGRAIPIRRRGKLFAMTQFVSGISRLAVAAVVFALLARGDLFPANFALLALGCALFQAASTFCLWLIREPPPAPEELREQSEDHPRFLDYLRTIPRKFRERPDFARLAAVQVLGSASGASAPFLLGYAKATGAEQNVADLAQLSSALGGSGLPGLFQAVLTIGLLFFAPIWGMITDRRGPKTSLCAMLTLALFLPVLALFAGSMGGNLILFLLAYLCFGAVMDGWATITNYLLDAVPKDEQPTYIALMNFASAPALVLAFGAGILVQTAGSVVLFTVTGLLLLVGLGLAVSLPETRRRVIILPPADEM
jgi:MFS family permease